MRALSIVLFCASAFGDAGNYGLIDNFAGPVDSVAISGNGKLVVGVSAAGAISVCRWPGTTAPNQLTYTTGTNAHSGAVWGIAGDSALAWLDHGGKVALANDAAPVIETTYAQGAVVTAFVVPEKDIAVFQIRFSSSPASSNAVWLADFSPCTSTMRAVPSSEMIFPARRDMTVFSVNGTVYHARPNDAGSNAWDKADEWAAGGAEPDWFKKGGGVWIGYTAATPIGDSICAAEEGEQSARALAQLGKWNAQTKTAGACASAVRVPVDKDGATIFIALAEHKKDVDSSLAYARQQGYAKLRDEANGWWAKRITAATHPKASAPEISALYERALRRLLVNVETESGAIARAPTSQPPLAVDAPRLGIWTTLALDHAGDTGAAGKQVRFYAKCVRTNDALGAPEGSLPAALFGAGYEAVPSLVLDVDATSWFLWSAWQHDAHEPDASREEYRKAIWKNYERASDFLSGWCRAVREAPVISFDPKSMSDNASLNTVALALAAIRSAESFAKATGHDKPEWTARKTELEDFLRFHALDANGNFKIDDPLALWPTDLVGAGDPRWDAPIAAAIDRVRAKPGPESLKALAEAAMLLRDQKEKLAQLDPLLVPTIQQTLDAYPCDAYYAALAVTAILTVHSDR